MNDYRLLWRGSKIRLRDCESQRHVVVFITKGMTLEIAEVFDGLVEPENFVEGTVAFFCHLMALREECHGYQFSILERF